MLQVPIPSPSLSCAAIKVALEHFQEETTCSATNSKLTGIYNLVKSLLKMANSNAKFRDVNVSRLNPYTGSSSTCLHTRQLKLSTLGMVRSTAAERRRCSSSLTSKSIEHFNKMRKKIKRRRRDLISAGSYRRRSFLCSMGSSKRPL